MLLVACVSVTPEKKTLHDINALKKAIRLTPEMSESTKSVELAHLTAMESNVRKLSSSKHKSTIKSEISHEFQDVKTNLEETTTRSSHRSLELNALDQDIKKHAHVIESK